VNKEEKIALLSFKVYEKRVSDLVRNCIEAGLRPLLIKGWAAARNYDEPWKRQSGDVDLLFHPRERSKVEALKEKKEFAFLDPHFGPRHLDVLSYDELFQNSHIAELEGVEINLLAPEDHLRVLCVHWLTDGGERKNRLEDIFWAVRNRGERFDWDRCLEILGPNRRKWVIYTIGLAHRFCELPVEDLYFSAEAIDLPDWLADQVEKSWREDIPLVPIHLVLKDANGLITQIRKRLPPNPIMATIAMEGSLDSKTRIHYQIGYIFKQTPPSLRRIMRSLTFRRHGK